MNNLKMIIIHNKDINHNQVNLMVILKYKKIPININKISLKLEKKILILNQVISALILHNNQIVEMVDFKQDHKMERMVVFKLVMRVEKHTMVKLKFKMVKNLIILILQMVNRQMTQKHFNPIVNKVKMENKMEVFKIL